MQETLGIRIATGHFDGPLSLLLSLIQEQEMDILKLNLSLLTSDYLLYLRRLKELNFTVAGEYLHMASTLLLLKSEECLRVAGEGPIKEKQKEVVDFLEIESKEELIRRLLLLKAHQKLATFFWPLEKKNIDSFSREGVKQENSLSFFQQYALQDLIDPMIGIIRRQKRSFKVVKRERLTIQEKLQYLKEILHKGMQTTFFELLQNSPITNVKEKKSDTIITFISLLELARLQKISLGQHETYQDIYIKIISDLKEFNIDLASGFSMPPEAMPAV